MQKLFGGQRFNAEHFHASEIPDIHRHNRLGLRGDRCFCDQLVTRVIEERPPEVPDFVFDTQQADDIQKFFNLLHRPGQIEFAALQNRFVLTDQRH